MPDENIIVINTGPIIALTAALGNLDILKNHYSKVIVPLEVCEEILIEDSIMKIEKFAALEFRKNDWLDKQSEKAIINEYLLNILDVGEASVIQTALSYEINKVCIDEAAGRRVARLSGLKVTGSLGILIKAKKKGYHFSIEEAINNMRKRGVWISKELEVLALNESGE